MFLLRLQLENIRSLKEIEIDFADPETVTRRWTLLLGENGCGKSTILRAVALVTAGSAALSELLGEPDTWIRINQKSCRLRAILVTATGEQRTVEFSIRRGDGIRTFFDRNRKTLKTLDDALAHASRNYMTVGYGVSRRFSPRTKSIWKDEQFRSPRAQAVATMFSPDATLQSVQNWAMDTHYRRKAAGLKMVKETLDGLLPGVQFDRIDQRERKVLFRTADGAVPLDQLSDGYQNVAAWCGDLVYRITELNPDQKNPLHARGLLLLDEIDLHLHPVWQRKLREFIDQKFPNLQILATTHSPLTAQQARRGELFFLRRKAAKLSAELIPFEGDPQKLMVHQLMLNPLFGLHTLDSQQTQENRKSYRELKGRRSLSADQKRRFLELKDELRSIPDWSTQSPTDKKELALLRDIRTVLSSRRH